MIVIRNLCEKIEINEGNDGKKLNRDIMGKNIIKLEGNTNDLFEMSKNGEMKQTRLFYLLPEDLNGNSETLDLTITSTNPYHSFPIFDKLLGKKIRISVDVIGDEE